MGHIGIKIEGPGYGLLVEGLSSVYEVLGLIPSSIKKEKENSCD
jgi:hypothetical protein